MEPSVPIQYNGAECPNTNWFRQKCIFFQNYQNQGQSTEGKEKERKKRQEEESNQKKSKKYQYWIL